MSASIHIKDGSLLVEIEGADKLWALRSKLEIPLANVTGAEPAEAEARKWLHGLRVGGTHIPGVISAGWFYSQRNWVFWDVHHPAKAISIGLRDERYARLVLEVEDPQEQIKQIRESLAPPA
jgi:hypothetical protein